MSSHEVKVVRVARVNPHPNADALELIPVWGYQCAVRKGDFKVGDLAVYIEPDYEVPLDRPEFSFLSKPGRERTKHRIAVMRLRGAYSQGLLLHATEGMKEGDNVMEQLGVTRWEPSESVAVQGSYAERGPEVIAPKYDLENFKKFSHLIPEGEDVFYTVKIHGTNGRFLFQDGRMWCGSRTQWKYESGKEFTTAAGETMKAPKNAWWEALRCNDWIEEWCRENPGKILYGEVFGAGVQGKFHYGRQGGDFGFCVFDILDENQKWVPTSEWGDDQYGLLSFVPIVHRGPHSVAKLEALAENEGKELAPTFEFSLELARKGIKTLAERSAVPVDHCREGIVIKLENERWSEEVGRVALKYVSNRYLEKS